MSDGCATCRFWVDGFSKTSWEKKISGECRRYPPTMRLPVSLHVETTANDWCGEWKDRIRQDSEGPLAAS